MHSFIHSINQALKMSKSIIIIYASAAAVLILSLLIVSSTTATATTITTAEDEKKLSRKECEDLGFTGLALCSDCNALSEYLKDQELLADCRKCCDEDSDDATSKIIYAGAVLEVCMRKLVFYPEVVNFIEDEKEKFPSVKVQYSFNAPPKLIMMDDAGQHKEIIRIDNWKREHIIEFLREKLKPTSAV